MKRLTLFLLTLSFSCSSIKIQNINTSDAFSLSSYKTFTFYAVEQTGDAYGPNYLSNLHLLKESIAKQMNARGLSLSADNPDLLVNIGIVVTEEIQTRETNFANPGDRTAYMGQRNYSWSAKEVEVGRYREGTVTLHLVERLSNSLVWEGSAESVVPEKEKNVGALIEEAMEKLFEKIK